MRQFIFKISPATTRRRESDIFAQPAKPRQGESINTARPGLARSQKYVPATPGSQVTLSQRTWDGDSVVETEKIVFIQMLAFQLSGSIVVQPKD